MVNVWVEKKGILIEFDDTSRKIVTNREARELLNNLQDLFFGSD